MGNTISFNHHVTADDDSLVMSNGLTDVLLDYLLLSGADLAYTDSEKRMMVFLSCVGCKICIEDLGKYPVEQEDPEPLKKFWYGTDAAPQGANTNEPNQ